MLELRDVCLTLGQRHYNFSLCVKAADIVVILGPSGSGKSTLLNIIAGFLSAVSGDIAYGGQSLSLLMPDERPVTSLFQKHNLFEHLSVWKNVALGIHSGAKLTEAQKNQLREALVDVGLAGFEQRMPNELSGGEQQRVALARCLVAKKPVLLLDEPYSALDAEMRLQMLRLTRKLVDKNQLCTILVTHDPGDAEVLGARTLKLANGRLQAV